MDTQLLVGSFNSENCLRKKIIIKLLKNRNGDGKVDSYR